MVFRVTNGIGCPSGNRHECSLKKFRETRAADQETSANDHYCRIYPDILPHGS